jgi:hypothetical protein
LPISWTPLPRTPIRRSTSPATHRIRLSRLNDRTAASTSAARRQPVSSNCVTSSAVSKFSPRNRGPKKTLATIEHNIATLLIEGPARYSSPGAECGKIYILSRPESNGFVKIGKTAGEISTRISHISPKGRYGNLTQHQDACDRPFKYFGFAERIIQEELCNVRYLSHYTAVRQDGDELSPPAAEQGKTEWYKLEPHQAENVKVRWREWLDSCEPYDEKGQLKGYWRDLILRREKYNERKHGEMSDRWSALLKPPSRHQLARYYFSRSVRICINSLAPTPPRCQGLKQCIPRALLVLFVVRISYGWAGLMVLLLAINHFPC